MVNTVEALNNQNSTLAASELSGISSGCIQENYMKQVLTIYNNTFVDSIYSFTPQQQADLEFIACKDPIADGPAVYSAQAMLGLFYGCSGGVMRSMDIDNDVNADTRVEPLVSVYPNPGNGEFTLEYAIATDAIISILDLNGKEVHNQKLMSGYNTINLQLHNLNNGVYVYRIHTDGQIIDQNRLVITK